MKKPLRFYSVTAAAFLAASTLNAQAAAPAATPPPSNVPELFERKDDPNKYVLVCTINTIDGNNEFQENVNKLRTQRQALVVLDQRQKEAITQPEKEALKSRIKTIEENLKANDQTMAQAYGFSLKLDYLLQIAKSRVYNPLTDEEYKQASEEDKKKPDYIISRKGTQNDKEVTLYFKQVAVVDGIEKNESFTADARVINELKQGIDQLEAILKRPELQKNETLRKKYESDLSNLKDALLKKSDEAYKNYNFHVSKPFLVQYEQTHLRTALDEKGYAAFLKDKKAKEEAKAKEAAAKK